MARNAMAKVLDVESTLEARRKESSERRNERSEYSENQEVKLIRNVGYNGYGVSKLKNVSIEAGYDADKRTI